MEVTDEAIHNIDKLIDDLNNLKCAVRLEVSQEECPNVDQILDCVVNVGKTLKEETAKVVIDKVLPTLLGHKSKQIVAKSAKAIAEIAKTHQGRKKCTTIELIRALIDLLKEDNIDILTQACSALGNICDENENGKNLVREQDGLKVILTVLKKGIALDNVEGASSLRIEATQFLYNFLEGQKASCMKALEEDMLPIICSILEQDGFSNGQAAVNVLITLDTLDKQNIVFLNERLTRFLVDILTSDISFDGLSMRCLQIFLDQAKDEKAMLLLYEAGVGELLEKLSEGHGYQRMYEHGIYRKIIEIIKIQDSKSGDFVKAKPSCSAGYSTFQLMYEGNSSIVTEADSDDDLSIRLEDSDDDLRSIYITEDESIKLE